MKIIFAVIVGLLLAADTSAAGIKVYPSVIRLPLTRGVTTETEFEVTNPTQEVQTISAYAEEPFVRIVPSEFLLNSGEIQTVKAIIYPEVNCQRVCRIPLSVEAREGRPGVGAGVKVILELQGNYGLGWIEVISSIGILLAALWITRFDKQKKSI